MQAKSSHLLRKAIAGILLVPGIQVPAAMAQQDENIEQIVVTGSYLRRTDNFDTISPVNIIDSVDISAQGAMQIGDVIRNQTFNYGTAFVANNSPSSSGDGIHSGVNLRGLGSGSTLVLVNGRRTLDGNVNTLYPQIAIGRIETLKDGGSALYGSDAVAGVVNFIPRMDFEGIETDIRYQPSTNGDDNYDETQFNLLLGGGDDQTRFVAALEVRQRGHLKLIERPEYARAGFTMSSTSNPGNWNVPTRNPDGTLTGKLTRMADPACGIDNGPGGTDLSKHLNHTTGLRSADGSQCTMDFGEWWNYVPELDAVTAWTAVEHKFSDNLTFVSEFSVASLETTGRGSLAPAGGRFGELGTIPGEFPGNPFRAMANRGNGLEPIFAQDLDGNGKPDRGPNGQVMLAADPYNPNQGVAFNEDVRPEAFRGLGKYSPLPQFNRGDGSTPSYSDGPEQYYRFSSGFQFEVPDSTWYAEVNYGHQRFYDWNHNNSNASFSAMKEGLAGTLGPNNDKYYNPFGTSVFQCVNRVCNPNTRTPPDDPAYLSQEALAEVFRVAPTRRQNQFNIVDVLATGEVFELPAGVVSLAIGGQWRQIDVETDEDSLGNACDMWINSCAYDFEASRETKSVFGEIGLPILNNNLLGELDLTAAVRYEDSGLDLQTTDPKVGLRWSPRPFLALRASFGTSFIAPGLSQVNGPLVSSVQNMIDPTCAASGACVASNATRTVSFGPNTGLKPESADIWSAGITLNLLDDDLSLSIDYLDYDFTDRITSESGNDILLGDLPRFRAFLANGGTRDQWINPTNKATGNFESQRIERTLAGEINTVFTSWLNADSMKWKGFDMGVSYRWDGDEMPFVNQEIGSFNFRLDGTYMDSFTTVTKGGAPVERAGRRNGTTGLVPFAPRIRANARLSWLMGQHSATVYSRYMHRVVDDGLFSFRNPRMFNSRVTYDAQYTLSLDSLLGFDGETGVTVGCINCFETMPDPIYDFGGMDTFMYDPRGRMWYGRVSLNF